jgi:hypothetical protein
LPAPLHEIIIIESKRNKSFGCMVVQVVLLQEQSFSEIKNEGAD